MVVVGTKRFVLVLTQRKSMNTERGELPSTIGGCRFGRMNILGIEGVLFARTIVADGGLRANGDPLEVPLLRILIKEDHTKKIHD
jgi:hypothetical protein